MRKILSHEEIERKNKRNGAIIGIFLLVILVLGTVGFAISSFGINSGTESQGNQEIVETNVYNLGGRQIRFSLGENSVANVSLSISKDFGSYQGKRIYVDSENDFFYQEIDNTLGQFSEIRRGCYGQCEEDFPEKTCSEDLIVIRDSEENRVYQEENCVFIEGNLKALDAFLYRIFGIN